MSALIDAAQPLLAPAFTWWGSPVTWLEIAAFAMGVAMVVCNLKVNPLGWPLAIASSLLYALLFAHAQLHGQALLQGFFVAVSAWGWWRWTVGRREGATATAAAPAPSREPGDHTRPSGHLGVQRMGTRERLLALAATGLAWPLVAAWLSGVQPGATVWADAFTTVASVTGQVLLGLKRVETWPVWVIVNVASMALFASQGLWLTVLLYAVFTALAVAGWRAWLRLAGQTQ